MKTKLTFILVILAALLIKLVITPPAIAATAHPQAPITTLLAHNPKLRHLWTDLGMTGPNPAESQLFLPLIAGAAQTDVTDAGHKPAVWPEARGYHRLVYSAEANRVFMVGGEAHSGWNDNLPGYGGLWSFDAGKQNWQKLQTSLPFAADWVTYDEAHERIIAYVAFHPPTTPDGFPELVSETWAYAVEKGEWENRHPKTHPPAGLLGGGSQMVYDSAAEKVIMFGGLDLFVLKQLIDTGDPDLLPALVTNNTWVYDYVSNQWTNRQPTNPPPARNSHALVYDPENERTLLFGGGDAFIDFADTWAYDYASNTWAALVPTNHPTARAYGYMAYDERANRVVLFGGVDYTETAVYGDTWLYDPRTNRWTQQSPVNAPAPRGWYDMVYSPKAKGIVLFGGGRDRFSFTNEAWIYQTKANRWVQVRKP